MSCARKFHKQVALPEVVRSFHWPSDFPVTQPPGSLTFRVEISTLSLSVTAQLLVEGQANDGRYLDIQDPQASLVCGTYGICQVRERRSKYQV